MSFERLSLFAQGDNDDGGYVILGIAVIAVVLLIVFIWKSFKSKGTPDTKTASPKKRAPEKHSITAEEVVNQRFMPTKFRNGYDQDEVDDLLDKTVRELQRLQEENERLQLKKANPLSGPLLSTEPILTPEQIVSQKFQPTKFREGYDQDQVDDFIDKIVVGLRQRISENDQLRAQLAGNAR